MIRAALALLAVLAFGLWVAYQTAVEVKASLEQHVVKVGG